MNFSLQQFDLAEMLRCGRELGRAAMGTSTLEEAAGKVVRYLYDNCVDAETGERECALVRFFVTQPYRSMPGEMKDAACRILGCPPTIQTMNCLALLATAGEDPAWNDRRKSIGHQAIPLPDARMVEQVPMLAELFRSLGVDQHALVTRDADLLFGAGDGKMYRVFFVPEAAGSPFIPAQDEFVRPHGIRSVLGWGGVLHGGELFAVILFTRVRIPEQSADRFRHVALDVKAALSLIGATYAAPAAEAVG
ncbi:MAG TPA: hypothetical protein VK358_15545 [Longimicrobium sp.]|jgi:hypothetical protein|nr:hypothetical protein [Longimicrobium sp.]